MRANERKTKALKAIAELKNEIKGSTNTDAAIQGIVTHLEKVLDQTDPKKYVTDLVKSDLRKHLHTLQYTSVYNTVANVIYMVFAIIAYPIAWLLGSLQHNEETNGSQFARYAFADKQKAQKALHIVAESLELEPSCRI